MSMHLDAAPVHGSAASVLEPARSAVWARLERLVDVALGALAKGDADGTVRAPAGTPAALAERVRARTGDMLPHTGVGDDEALRRLTLMLAAGSVNPADPACAAHLQCPPLPVAVATSGLTRKLVHPRDRRQSPRPPRALVCCADGSAKSVSRYRSLTRCASSYPPPE